MKLKYLFEHICHLRMEFFILNLYKLFEYHFEYHLKC